MTHVVDTFCDESSDQKQQEILCVSGFVAYSHFWKPLERQWVETLAREGVRYFSAKECKSVQGPFYHLRKKCGSLEAAKEKAASIRASLENILVPSPSQPPAQWHGFALGVVIPDYNDVLQKIPIAHRFYAKDPTVAAYMQIMYEIVRVVRRNLKGWGVAYIIDRSNDSPKIAHAFEAMKKHHPTCGKSAKTCAPFDDEETPGLQMADMFAGAMRERFEQWIASGRKSDLCGKWITNTANAKVGLWDKDFMLKSLSRTVRHPRFKAGTLTPQPPPSRRDIRRNRRKGEELRNDANAKNETAQ
jgi:Protein of unknown function (DUF3800)